MATVEELKEMIVDLRMEIVKAKIPDMDCPYVHFRSIESPTDCNDISCEKCKDAFFLKIKEKFENEVAQI